MQFMSQRSYTNLGPDHSRAEEKRIKKGVGEGDEKEVFDKWNKWLRKKAEEAMAALTKVNLPLNM